jgi:hypothetical protein
MIRVDEWNPKTLGVYLCEQQDSWRCKTIAESEFKALWLNLCEQKNCGYRTTTEFLKKHVMLCQVMDEFLRLRDSQENSEWNGDMETLRVCSGLHLRALARYSGLDINLWRSWAKNGVVPVRYRDRVKYIYAEDGLQTLQGRVRRDGRSVSTAINKSLAERR